MNKRHSRWLTWVAPTLIAASIQATAVHAQTWATPQACEVTTTDVDQYLKDPDILATARDLSDNIPDSVGRLWKITAGNGAVSHLWGTFHSSAHAILDLPDEMQARLTGSRLLTVEIDYRPSDRSEYQRMMSYEGWWQNTYLPPEPLRLIAGADPRIGDWINDRLLTSGIDPQYVDYLTPGGVFSILLSDPCEDFSAGVLPVQDNYIQTLAYIEGKTILGMEAPLTTILALNNPKNEAYAQALITTYGAHLQPTAETSGRLSFMALYRSGHIGAMMEVANLYQAELLGPGAKKAQHLTHEFLVTDRNIAFLDVARPELKVGGVFMAVGAFHLPGEMGLIDLLRKDGFTVERIRVEGEDD